MSISFDVWYRDYSKMGFLKSIQNWEITQEYVDLFTEIASQPEVDMNDLIKKTESLEVPLDKLKEAARTPNVSIIWKCD